MGDFCILLILCALRPKAPQKAAKKPHFGPIFRKNQGLRSSETSHRSQNPSHGSPFPWDVSVCRSHFCPEKPARRTKTPAGSCRNFLENQGYCPWSGKPFRAKHPRPAAGCIVRPLPSAGARSRREHRAPRNASPTTTHRKHAFFGQKRPTFCNLRLAKSHKKNSFCCKIRRFGPEKAEKFHFYWHGVTPFAYICK